MGSVGTVTVDVIPDADGFQRTLRNQLPLRQLDSLGQDMGRRVAKQYGRAFAGAIGGSLKGVQSSMARAVGGTSAPVSRAATSVGRTAGKAMQTGMTQYGLQNWTASAGGQRLAQRFGTQLGAGGARYAASSLTTGLGQYGIRADLSKTQFGRSISSGVSSSVQRGMVAGASRHHSNGNAGAAAAFMLPQVGTGPISGMLAMTATTPKMLALAGAVAGVGTAMMGAVQAGQLAVGGMQAYGAAAKYAVEQAGQLEQTAVAMETLFGSAAKGQEMLGKSIEFAKQTPFDLPAVTNGVKQLKAYGFAAQDVLPMLEDIGDASSALGLGSYGIQRMVMAFGQIKARGTFRADEARQLTEAGIPAWRAIAEAISKAEGKTVGMAEVMKRAEAGTIKAGFAIKALRAEMQKSFGGAMRAQSLTFLGTMEKLKDATNIGLQVAMQPALKSLSATLQTVTPDIERLSYVLGSNLGAGIEGFAKTLTAGLGGNLKSLGESFGPLLAKLGPRFGAILDDVITALANFGPAISDVVDGFYSITKSATSMFETLSGGAGVLEGFTNAFKGMADAGSFFPNLLQQITGNGDEMNLDAVSEAQAQITGMGRELSSAIENTNPNLPKFAPEIDIDGLKRGVPLALDKTLAYLEANPTQADLIGIDPAAFRERVAEAVSDPALDGQFLTGEQEVILDVKVASQKAESQLASLAAKVANVGEYSAFGIDPGSLQEMATAMSQLQQLSNLSNRNLKTVLGVDSSGVKAARAEIDGLLAYMQYADPTLTPEVRTERIEYGMARMTALFDAWRGDVETRDTLVGLKINPQSLSSFNPETVKQLLGLNKQQFVKLGVQPGQIAGFKSQLKALLGAGAGAGQFEIPVKPKITAAGGSGFWGAASSLGKLAGRSAAVSIPTKYKEPPPLKLKDPEPVTVGVELNPAGLNKAKGEAESAAQDAGNAFVSSLEMFKDPAAEAGSTVATGSTDALNEASGAASSAGANAGSGFVSGISSYSDAAYSAGAALAAAANQGMKDNLEINSPSKVTMRHGLSVGEGFVKGMRDSERSVEAAGASLARKAEQPLGKSVEKRFDKLFKRSNKRQKASGKILGGIDVDTMIQKAGTPGDQSALDAFQVDLDNSAFKLESSAWQLEQAQRKIDVLMGRIQKRRAKLDREIGDKKPNAAQKRQRRELREEEVYLNGKSRRIATEEWQNRKQQRNATRLQKAVDKRRRVLERAAAVNEIKWEANDTLSEARGADASASGINASIRDLERRLRRNQIPEEAKQTVRDTIDALRPLYDSAVIREAFAPVQEAFDSRTLRDLSWDGVDDWVKNVKDAIDFSDLNAAQKGSLSVALDRQLGSVRAYAARLERITKAKDLKQQLIDAVGGSIDWNRTTSSVSLSRTLRRRTAEMQRYAASMTALRQGGLSDKALQRIAAMDPARAAKFTQKLIAGGPAAINEFNDAVAGFNVAAESVGDYGAAAAWAETGAQAGQGFIAGMQSQESAIRQALKDLASNLVTEFKTALGIASPSKVFAEAASWIPLGMVRGIESERAAVQDSVRSLVRVPRMPRVPSPAGGLAAGGGGNQIQIDVHPREHMDERETARMVARQLAWEVL